MANPAQNPQAPLMAFYPQGPPMYWDNYVVTVTGQNNAQNNNGMNIPVNQIPIIIGPPAIANGPARFFNGPCSITLTPQPNQPNVPNQNLPQGNVIVPLQESGVFVGFVRGTTNNPEDWACVYAKRYSGKKPSTRNRFWLQLRARRMNFLGEPVDNNLWGRPDNSMIGFNNLIPTTHFANFLNLTHDQQGTLVRDTFNDWEHPQDSLQNRAELNVLRFNNVPALPLM